MQATSLEAAWDALERGAWADALSFFAALAVDSGDPSAHEGLAWAAWWTNDSATLFDARESAYRLYRDTGDPVSAARVAIWLGSDHNDFRGAQAVANGWYQRARRLLTDVPTSPEHGWLSFQEGAYALELEEDTATARTRAAEVAAVARELGVADLEFLGLALDGLALVTEGAVDEGMRRLDEVGVAATSGELKDRIAAAWGLCYLIYACERVRDFDRAAQWCARMQEVSTRFVFDLGVGVCRAHYGGVLMLHGKWEQAEDELLAAADIIAQARPLAVVESDVRLGELRRRQGRADDARKLFEGAQPHPFAVVGLAHLALDDGDPAHAAEMLDDLLAVTPPAALTQRADALELLARARSSLGDTEHARAAAVALSEIAAAVRTTPLRAMAASAAAAAATAEGDHHQARRRLEEAVDRFARSGLPYEADCARIELARVLTHLQRTEAAAKHARQAADRLRALGALYAAQLAEREARAETATAPGTPSPLDVLSTRETEVLALLADGLSDREIAERLVISAHTVHRHVSNILTKLALPTRAAAAAVAGRHGVAAPPT